MKIPPEPNPKIVNSSHSGPFAKNGHTIEVCIYRFEDESEWTLEVVDVRGNSTIWSEDFKSDEDAWDALMRTIDVDGIESFVPPAR